MRIIVHCDECGSENPPSANFCRECGAKLEFSTQQTEGASGGGKSKSREKELSYIWWILPIFLLFIGGIIAWYKNKDRDPKKSKWMLILGFAMIVPFSLLGKVIPVEEDSVTASEFQVSNLTVSPSEIEPGQTVTASVVVKNTGENKKTEEVHVDIAGKTKSRNVTLNPGESSTATFTFSRKEEGTYEVKASGMSEEVEVVAPPTKRIVDGTEDVHRRAPSTVEVSGYEKEAFYSNHDITEVTIKKKDEDLSFELNVRGNIFDNFFLLEPDDVISYGLLIDTNEDGEMDYLIARRATSSFYGGAYNVMEGPYGKIQLKEDFPGSYEAKKSGFVLNIPLSALGNPQSFKWNVLVMSTSYDAVVAEDFCPDLGESNISFP